MHMFIFHMKVFRVFRLLFDFNEAFRRARNSVSLCFIDDRLAINNVVYVLLENIFAIRTGTINRLVHRKPFAEYEFLTNISTLIL